MGALVGDVLDLVRRVAEQLVSKIGQGPRGRYLLTDLHDLLVIGVTTGQAMANGADAGPAELRRGQRLPLFLAE